MKCSDFATLVVGLSDALLQLESKRVAVQLKALAPLFEAQPSKTVVAVVNKLRRQRGLDQVPNLSRSLVELKIFVEWFERYGKPAASKDFAAVIALLRDLEVHDLGTFVSRARECITPAAHFAEAAPREDVVKSYLERLEVALADDTRFATIVSELNSSAIVSNNELFLIAKRFALASVKSRAAAIKKIVGRHQALLTRRAKSAATGGRVAG